MTDQNAVNKLLEYFSHERIRPSRYQRQNLLQEAISDKNRIVFSSAYRRLQAKTQVFPLQENDAVHTRLTHTCEVATIGQNLAFEIATRLKLDHCWMSSLLLFVECACLLHDIGNPPFGHFGEFAVRDWFKSNLTEIAELHGLKQELFSDFLNFDGNPQGFRIVTKLLSVSDQSSLNLTATVLASYLKYLGCKCEPDKPYRKKLGYFLSEQKEVELVRKMLEMGEHRHPFTYIMEAADDIAYCFSDIEDGLEKGMFDLHYLYDQLSQISSKVLEGCKPEIVTEIRDLLDKYMPKPNSTKKSEGLYRFRTFKAELSDRFVKRSAQNFCNNLSDILDNSTERGLMNSDAVTNTMLKIIGKFSRDSVYRTKEAIDVELSGYEIIVGIFDCYKKLLLLNEDEFYRLDHHHPSAHKLGCFEVEKRLFYLLPPTQKNAYYYAVKQQQQEFPEIFYRMHLIVDFIAGMTDTYALKVYQMLHGIDATGRG